MRTPFVLALPFLLLAACKDPQPAAGPATTTVTAAEEAAPSPSLYPLALTLRDQHDATVRLDVFRGHPVIVSMFYGSCPTACPLIVSRIKQIEASLPADVRAKTRVLLVSFDPERDTPAALREMAANHHADAARWRLASGADDEVRQLANALGVVYRKGEEGFFSHNSVISVLDGEGRVTARVDDAGADHSPLARAVARAAR